MCSHVPNRGEQRVRYYGWHSNVTRGKRLKRAEHDAVPYIIESDRSPAACRKSWARLIQKIYEVDPLICPKCRGTMQIISSIEDREIIKTILQHLGLWLIRLRPPAKAHAPPSREYAADSFRHTAFHDDAVYGDHHAQRGHRRNGRPRHSPEQRHEYRHQTKPRETNNR